MTDFISNDCLRLVELESKAFADLLEKILSQIENAGDLNFGELEYWRRRARVYLDVLEADQKIMEAAIKQPIQGAPALDVLPLDTSTIH